jgi:hypothetical protein
MNFEELYKQLVNDFNLKELPEEDREDMLLEISKAIQKQFLFDVYDILGEQQFDALQASAQMGEEFYATTLKHLLPSYEEVFQGSRKKVVAAFNAE